MIDGTGVDPGFVACLGASLGGLLSSTLWVVTAPSSVAALGLLFLFAGIGICYLGLVTNTPGDGADPATRDR